jgi:antitoxin FitA
MPQVLVRSLDRPVLNRLKARAKRNGRSLQAELKAILEDASRRDLLQAYWVALRIRRALKGRRFPDTTEMVAEDRRR